MAKPVYLVGLFLNSSLADSTKAAALYQSVAPYQTLSFIGAISNTRQSDIFHTGWSLNSEIRDLPEIKLIVQLKPLVELVTEVKARAERDLTNDVASKFAASLVYYAQSFNENHAGALQILVNKWHDRFNKKYAVDPNFVFKSDNCC